MLRGRDIPLLCPIDTGLSALSVCRFPTVRSKTVQNFPKILGMP